MKRIRMLILAIGVAFFTQVAQAQWTPAKRLTWNSGDSQYPVIAVDSSGDLHVLWADDPVGNSEIYYRKSTDGGGTWTASRRLTWTSGHSFVPDIGFDPSGNIHVVWSDYTPGNHEIYYKKSTDGGASWSTSQRLTSNAGASISPVIAVDSSGHLHVVWQGSASGNVEVFYKKSADGGTSWTISRRLSLTSGVSFTPVIAVDSSDNLHVAWADDTPGNYEIYYKKSTDGGASWTANERLTWTSSYSWEPSIAVDSSGTVHIVWYDNTPGNWEIYYKKGK